MFHSLILRGVSGALVWGYRDVAQFRRWALTRTTEPPYVWTLTGVVDSLDARLLTKRDLVFTAPRQGRCGLWCFPVIEARQSVSGALVVTVRPPEY